MAKVGDIEIKLKVETNKFNSDMKRSEQAAKKFSKNTKSSVKNMAKSVKGSLMSVKGAVGGLVAAFAAFKGISATKNLVMDFAKSGREINSWAITLGIGTTQLQAFAAAGKAMNFSFAKTTDILKDVSDKIGDFKATGGGEAKELFKRLGLSDLSLAGKNPVDALQAIVNRMDSLKGTVNELNQQEKVFLFEAIANDTSKLMPLLVDGAAKMKQFAKEAQMSGAIISPEELKNLEVFESISRVIGMQWEGIKKIFVINLLPSVTKLASKIRDAFKSGDIQKWVKNVAGKMGEMLDNAAKKIPMMVDAFKAAIPALQTIGELLAGMAKGFGLALDAAKGYGRYLGFLSASLEGISLKSQRGEYDPNAKSTGGSGSSVSTSTQSTGVDSVSQIMKGLLKDRAASDAARIQKEAADKQAAAAKEQQAAAQLVKKRSETAIGQILGNRGRGETSRILGEGPKQAQSDNFDRIFRDLVQSIQSGDSTKRSQQYGIDMLKQIAGSHKMFGAAGSTLGMENAIKDLQNFISGKKDDEIKVNISVDVKPSDKFDTELETKIERINGNSFGDAAAAIGQ